MPERSTRALQMRSKAAFGELPPRGTQPGFNLFTDPDFRSLTRQSRVPVAQKGKQKEKLFRQCLSFKLKLIKEAQTKTKI